MVAHPHLRSLLPLSFVTFGSEYLRIPNGNRVWLAFTHTFRNFDAARQRCLAEGGDLAMLLNQADNSRLLQAFASIDYSNFTDVNAFGKVYGVYIGLASPTQSRVKSDWVWLITDQTPDWDGWAWNQPNNGGNEQGRCGIMSTDPVFDWDRRYIGQWDDGSCDHPLPFVCEVGKADAVGSA